MATAIACITVLVRGRRLVPDTRALPEHRVADRREAVLTAALELFERDGYGNVAMSRIAR